jgi:hypothetical protein
LKNLWEQAKNVKPHALIVDDGTNTGKLLNSLFHKKQD